MPNMFEKKGNVKTRLSLKTSAKFSGPTNMANKGKKEKDVICKKVMNFFMHFVIRQKRTDRLLLILAKI